MEGAPRFTGNLPDITEAAARLRRRGVVRRIWDGDHTVWKPDPTEISDRLGWLTCTDDMREQLPELQRFGGEVKAAGFRHVVLLGMGGSSLGPEVLRQTFGSVEGYPELIVLDSTLPGLVGEVTRRVDPGETMFLVSSKSGSTIEPNTLYAHFRARVVEAVGMKNAGGNFAAVTDPGTVLERLAREAGFRRAFLNPPEIGGRYSVLSYFGLVPAALTGLDLGLLLDRADKIRHECGPEFDPETNPGALLGLVMAAAQREGRDKLTVVASPGIASVGLWVEQMLAESLGKEGTGIIPVAGEPVMGPEAYGKDRLFVYLRLAGDDNGAGDLACESLMTAGHSVLQLDLADRYDLGGEFFRWEFATAVAGAVLGIHPFDQPDVQSAKDRTDAMLDDYQARGELPPAEDVGSLGQVLEEGGAGDYLSVLVYARQTPEMDGTLTELRRLVMGKYRIATTVGYGPRYLHSTGQLHKGGPGSGLFLQLVGEHREDVNIPGYPFSFGVLSDAQSRGDFQALEELGRRCVRVNLADGIEEGLQQLLAEITK